MRGVRRKLVEKTGVLPVTRQCEILDVSRSSVYYHPVEPDQKKEEAVVNAMTEIWNDMPSRGARYLRNMMQERGIRIGRKGVAALMSKNGIVAICPKPNLSKPNKQHRKFPYLLRGVVIERPNQVWSTDITYIRLAHGFAYLVAIIDWYSRMVLSWRVSNSLESSFCVEALQEALLCYGEPEIFNTDQGSQFTSEDFLSVLEKRKNIKISMDGVGRAIDNIFIERLWRTVKYEDVFLKRYETIPTLKAGLSAYFQKYNHRRPHQALDDRKPVEVYFSREVAHVA